MDRVIEDYETKLRAKEAKQHELQKQLGDLAIAVNMEAYKKKKVTVEKRSKDRYMTKNRIDEDRKYEVKLDDNLNKGDREVRKAIYQHHKLDGDLSTAQDKIFQQNRDRNRQLQDVRFRLKKNRKTQQNLGKQSQLINFDINREEQNENIERHTEKRTERLNKWLTDKIQSEQAQEDRLYNSAQNWQFAQKVVKQEEAVQHMDRIVQQCTVEEKSLYSDFRDSDLKFQNAAQEVHKLQNRLLDQRRQNAEKIKNEMTEVNQEEQTMLQQLLKKQAEMNKLLAKRSFSYQRLQQQSSVNREHRELLDRHQNELEHTRGIQQATAKLSTSKSDDAK